LICVSGDLGAAYMGLLLLDREKKVFAGSNVQPDFAGKEYIIERQLKPQARVEIIHDLAKNNIQPTAMIDISDGLSSELLHICKQSKVGCVLAEEFIPIDYQTAIMAEELGMSPLTAALNGGEDYELLFTVPLSDYDKIKAIRGVNIIGHITEPQSGAVLQTKDGSQIELKAQGWNPL